MKISTIALALIVVSFIFVGTHSFRSSKENTSPVDESSFANINEVIVEHFDLKLNIDFDRKVISGTNTLLFRTESFDISTVYLDVRDLTVFNVTDVYGNNMKFEIDNPNPNLGQRLKITIPTKWIQFETFTLVVKYETSPSASAVTWLTKEQTSGKKQPYMYTQCESIHCRSIAPLQDTPAVKSTYTLDLTTPTEIVVRASGNVTHEYIDETYRHTQIEMKLPVPSYLLAVAAGNLVEKAIGSRTFIITEPEDQDKVANEFVHLEDLLNRAEATVTPYVWNIYKILVLPPSFPFGGMENPLLTFVSPTIVVGDRSSVDVAVHEICHSWFGNLVTNQNWSHFWLNEGFTTYLERKVDSYFDGVTASMISAKLENETMYFDMIDLGFDSNFTSLNPKMNGNHPDGSMTTIPYEKGFQFLTYLEKLISESNMIEFLKSYITKFAGKSIKTQDFVDHFKGYVYEKFDSDKANKILSLIEFDKWINAPGLPPVKVDLDTPQYTAAIALSDSFIHNTPDPAAKDMYSKMTVNLKGLFISHFIKHAADLTKDLIAVVESTLSVSSEINPEIIYRWLQVAIRSGFMEAPYTAADDFLGRFGRMKMIVPVYQALTVVNIDVARQIYAKHKDFYHPIAQSAIESLLRSPMIVTA